MKTPRIRSMTRARAARDRRAVSRATPVRSRRWKTAPTRCRRSCAPCTRGAELLRRRSHRFTHSIRGGWIRSYERRSRDSTGRASHSRSRCTPSGGRPEIDDPLRPSAENDRCTRIRCLQLRKPVSKAASASLRDAREPRFSVGGPSRTRTVDPLIKSLKAGAPSVHARLRYVS